MERIMIIGCGGSGKSTLARKLGAVTGLPVVHLDQIYWRPGNWEHLSHEDFDKELAEELNKPRWIMDGNFNRTMEQRLEFCDTVIYLDFSRITCLMGLCKRVLTNYGKARQDMAPGCKEKFDPEFVRWIWNFNKNYREKYLAMLAQRTELSVYILKNRRQVRRFLKELSVKKPVS